LAFAGVWAGLLVLAHTLSAASPAELFEIPASLGEWSEFAAAGYAHPVSGIVYGEAKTCPCCGVPLGGLSTGCLDVDVNGTLGFCSIFNGYPRQPKLAQPFLGLSVGDQVWVAATKEVVDGGLLKSCIEPGRDPYYPERQTNKTFWHALREPMTGVRPMKALRYWGHYPIADITYESDAPVALQLRAWAPFIPGDVKNSDVPAAMFEVELENSSEQEQRGAVALSFDAPLQDVVRANYHQRQGFVGPPPVFSRRDVAGGSRGVIVSYQHSAYAMVALSGDVPVRTGGALGETTWADIAHALPPAADNQAGASLAVDFKLQPHERKTVRFMLAWSVPTWGETGTVWKRMNAKTFPTVQDVVAYMEQHHESLLRRIIAWQEAIYASREYPVWLRDSLVNSLALIAESGYYAQPTGPLADWCGKEGLFGMIECPRACPQIECIPCSWYGNMPIVYFFPGLARTTLEGYRQYQREDGAAPFCFGPQSDMWQANNNHAHDNQIMLNGVCYVDMVYRLWKRTGDQKLLERFYDSVKRSTTLTATMGERPYEVVGFPPGDAQTEWWEGWPWTGIATHAAGMHLSNLLAAKQMAEAMGDEAFARQCREWFKRGSDDLESSNWQDGSYLLYNKPQTGQSSDKVMSNQLDAEWANRFLGIDEHAFRPERTRTALETIRRTCFHPLVGAVSFASRDGAQELTTYGIFPPETLILGMTYMYQNQREVGLDLCHRAMRNLVISQGKEWDLPNMVNADTGAVRFGTDYYQMMILWAVPAALEGQSVAEFCAPGGLVDRVLAAGREETSK
jgi:uncharacterized protein (DUF608 family)